MYFLPHCLYQQFTPQTLSGETSPLYCIESWKIWAKFSHTHNLFNVVFDYILPTYFMIPLMLDYIVSVFFYNYA